MFDLYTQIRYMVMLSPIRDARTFRTICSYKIKALRMLLFPFAMSQMRDDLGFILFEAHQFHPGLNDTAKRANVLAQHFF